jgi:hypothetical protein
VEVLLVEDKLIRGCIVLTSGKRRNCSGVRELR